MNGCATLARCVHHPDSATCVHGRLMGTCSVTGPVAVTSLRADRG